LIDVHGHYVSSRALAEATKHGQQLGVAYDPSSRVLTLPTGAVRPFSTELTDLNMRRLVNQERGIRTQVLSPGFNTTGEGSVTEKAVSLCVVLNNHLAEDIANDDRFVGYAAVPLLDGAAAARELRRSIEELGMKGCMIGTQVSGSDLDEAGLEPLFEAAASLHATVFIHPLSTIESPRFQRRHLFNVCGYPVETCLAALALYVSGLFDRWPTVRVLLAHGGGVLPIVAGRAAYAASMGLIESKNAPLFDQLLDNFNFDSVVHDAGDLGRLISKVGPERVALGTDAPFAMAVLNPGDLLRAAVNAAQLDAAAYDQVSVRSGARLIGR
jgi:aminocarboxymuconate-semialdehyde decarboxylase